MTGNVLRMHRSVIMVSAAFFLAGCLRMEGEMRVQPSGAVQARASIGLPMRVMAFMPPGERSMFCTAEQLKEKGGILGDAAVRLQRRVQGRFVYCDVSTDARHVSELIDMWKRAQALEKGPRLRNAPAPLRRNDDGTYSIVIDFNALDSKPSSGPNVGLATAMLGDATLSFDFSAPHIENVEGATLENGKVKVRLSLAQLLLANPKPVIRIRFWCRREGPWYDLFGWFSRKTC